MRKLYHAILSPYCRKVRLVLGEKKLEFQLVEENIWKPSDVFEELNPLRTLPVFVDKQDDAAPVISNSMAIVEYLEEVYGDRSLIMGDASGRAEVRRLSAWFDERFNAEVSQYVLYEKIEKRRAGLGAPDLNLVRLGLENIGHHFDYITLLMEDRKWLAGNEFSLADISAAAHISCLDYLGDVPWVHYPQVKDWYVRIKSRPCFRSLLKDRVPGLAPTRHYADLDF